MKVKWREMRDLSRGAQLKRLIEVLIDMIKHLVP